MYKPISCSYYDELEALATLRKSSKIEYFDHEHEKAETEGIIQDLYIRNKVEYLKLNTGFELRLDHLISVDGKKMAGYC